MHREKKIEEERSRKEWKNGSSGFDSAHGILPSEVLRMLGSHTITGLPESGKAAPPPPRDIDIYVAPAAPGSPIP